MSKHDRKLDLITGIPADLLELCAARRFKLLEKRRAAAGGAALADRNKHPFFHKRVLTTAIAALLFLAVGLSLFFLLFGGDKQVPVYLGMTVSKEAPAQIERTRLPYRTQTLYNVPSSDLILLESMTDGGYNGSSAVSDGSSAKDTAGAPIYYVNSGEDFYITVHIDNPDKFEIVSFTLNGEKYSSYMFEDGSDMENLILKCNAGDAKGIVEYTIDAIKYIDGTEIKDVRLEGDQTVKVGVYTEDQPTAALSDITANFDQISVAVTVNDAAGLLTLTESRVYAVLYKEASVVNKQQISFNETSVVHFTGLNDGTEYRVAVVADYDALDGAGKSERIIAEQTIETPAVVTAQVSAVSHAEAIAKLVWHDDAPDKNAVSFALYKGGKKIRDLSGDETKLADLQSGIVYTLIVEYKYNGSVRTRSINFTTESVSEPTLAITDVQPDLYSVSMKLSKNDPNDLLTVDKVELKLDGTVVATASDGNSVTFTDLEVLKTYTVEVTYSYDLMDGTGKQTKTALQSVVTQSKGLEIYEGAILGIGTCTDKEVYINMPLLASAFRGSSIVSVVMGDGVTEMGPHAFQECVLLTNVELSDTLTAISFYAFESCTALTDITLHDGITCIEEGAFNGSGLQTIRFGKNTETIGALAFAYCDDLLSIALPEGLEVLDEQMFLYSTNLVSVTLPDGLKTISNGAFKNCHALEEINLPQSIEAIGDNAFEGCYKVRIEDLPDSLTTIGDYAFNSITLVSNFQTIIPSTVTHIGVKAFNCKVICVEASEMPETWKGGWAGPSSYVIWGAESFETDMQGVCYVNRKDGKLVVVGHDGLSREVILPDGVIAIVEGVFQNCEKLQEISIPDGVEIIEEDTFRYCTHLYKVTLPDTLTTIKEGAFSECWGLTEMTLPDSVTYIADRAFQGCGELGRNDFPIPSGVTYIGDYAFEGSCLQSIVIPEGVTKIGDYAFIHCVALADITLPQSLKEIGTNAFQYCTSIRSITLPDGLEIIGEYAFDNATVLYMITIPKSVQKIGNYAFGDYGFIDIYCEVASKPDGWHDRWAGSDATVYWNATAPATKE
ncbi:MAG: leucine-rich repeat protein [Clostridia bacterium]|nr:leucine-rich repeat protein [Clostridia bacterium]